MMVSNVAYFTMFALCNTRIYHRIYSPVFFQMNWTLIGSAMMYRNSDNDFLNSIEKD